VLILAVALGDCVHGRVFSVKDEYDGEWEGSLHCCLRVVPR
jgi:hypothetical protein